MDPIGDSFKSFWERKEGKLGIWVLAAIVIGGVLVGWSFIIPWIIRVMENTLLAVAYGVGLSIIAAFALSKQFHLILIYWFKLVMQWLATGTIAMDKVGVLKVYQTRYTEMIAALDTDIVKVGGELRGVKAEIEATEAEMNDAAKEIDYAQKHGGDSTMAQRKIARRRQSGQQYLRIRQGIEGLYMTLCSYRKACQQDLEDIGDQITDESRTLRVARAGSSAVRRMKNFVEQRGSDRAFYDMSIESIHQERDARLGEVDDFLSRTHETMKRVDLRRGMAEEEGLELWEEWKKNPESLMLGSSKQALVAAADNPAVSVNLTAKPDDVAMVPARRGDAVRHGSLFHRQ